MRYFVSSECNQLYLYLCIFITFVLMSIVREVEAIYFQIASSLISLCYHIIRNASKSSRMVSLVEEDFLSFSIKESKVDEICSHSFIRNTQ